MSNWNRCWNKSRRAVKTSHWQALSSKLIGIPAGLQIVKAVPADESTTGETRGTIAAADSDFEPAKTVEGAEFEDQSTTTETPQSLRTDAPELRLKGALTSAETIGDTGVYVGSDAPNGENEAEYIPYREVFLNAKQEYAEAIANNRIPVRYRQLIDNYLEAITNP